MTPREETARIIMPQSGVGATPHKGLITENKGSAVPQSDVWATSHKGLIFKVRNKRHAAVGRLSDIT